MPTLTKQSGAQFPVRDAGELAYGLFDLAVSERAAQRIRPMVEEPPDDTYRTEYYHGAGGDWTGLPSPMPDTSSYGNLWPTAVFASPDFESAHALADQKGGYRKIPRVYEAHIPAPERVWKGDPPLVPPGDDPRDFRLPKGWGALLEALTPYMDPSQEGWDVSEAIDRYLQANPSAIPSLPRSWQTVIEETRNFRPYASDFRDALSQYWDEVEPLMSMVLQPEEQSGWQYDSVIDWTRRAADAREWERAGAVGIMPPDYARYPEDEGQVLILKPFGVRWSDVWGEFLIAPYGPKMESIREIRAAKGIPGNEWLRRMDARVQRRADRLAGGADWPALAAREYWTDPNPPAVWPSVDIAKDEEIRRLGTES